MDEMQKGSFLNEPSPHAWPKRIRLVSWNVNRGLRLPEIIDFLEASSADLILLQETDVNARRTRFDNVPRKIAAALKMDYVFGCEFEELAQRNGARPALHGQTTLSRFPLSNPRILRFQHQSTFWLPRWFIPRLPVFQRRLGARMALVCETSLDGRTLVMYNAHLESRGDDGLRYSQLSEMLREADRDSEKSHLIVAGDLNFNIADSATASLVAGARLNNPFVCLEGKCTVRGHARHAIDWVLTDTNLSTSNPAVHDFVQASDHYPLTLELHIEGDLNSAKCHSER